MPNCRQWPSYIMLSYSTLMQGGIFSAILCTSTMDKIAKDSKIKPLKYRESVDIPKLGYVEDIVDIAFCGEDSSEMNKFTNHEINKRKLPEPEKRLWN